MTCDCITDIESRLSEHKLDTGLSISADLKTMTLTTYTPLVRRDNGRAESRSSKPRQAVHTFCPFCGSRYQPTTDADLPRPGWWDLDVERLHAALAQIAAEVWVPLSEMPNADQPNGWRKIAVERIEIARAAIAAMGEGAATGMPSDVRRLVIAARIVTDQGDDPHNEEMRELLDAVEAFSSRVPYEEGSFSSLHAAVRSEGGAA